MKLEQTWKFERDISAKTIGELKKADVFWQHGKWWLITDCTSTDIKCKELPNYGPPPPSYPDAIAN